MPATTPAERDALANNPDFQIRVKMPTLKAANDLLAAVDQPTYVTQYAQMIVTEPNGGGWLSAMTYGVLTNPVINEDSSDEEIQFTVNSIFNKYAKAYYRVVDEPVAESI